MKYNLPKVTFLNIWEKKTKTRSLNSYFPWSDSPSLLPFLYFRSFLFLLWFDNLLSNRIEECKCSNMWKSRFYFSQNTFPTLSASELPKMHIKVKIIDLQKTYRTRILMVLPQNNMIIKFTKFPRWYLVNVETHNSKLVIQ